MLVGPIANGGVQLEGNQLLTGLALRWEGDGGCVQEDDMCSGDSDGVR